MSRVIIAPQAREDLVDLWEYVAQDNPGAADRLLAAIDSRCVLLSRAPRSGRARPELGPGIRSVHVGTTVILYRPVDDGIEVARVFSGFRDLSGLFK